MTGRTWSTTARRAATATLAVFASMTAAYAGAAPAGALPVGGGTAAACLRPADASTPAFRRGLDTSRVSTDTAREVQQVLRQTSAATGEPLAARTSSAERTTITVPVYIHLIRGRHRGDRNISKYQARWVFGTLRAGFAGGQNPAAMTSTGFNFVLKSIRVTRNDRWYHAAPFSAADRRMKRRLHRGNARALNIYLNRAEAGGLPLLGFSRFPWQYRGTPRQDGVTINVEALRGGRAVGYNLGDTLIHETGHWLGLFHTFERGCGPIGDAVSDTPAEAEPSFTCPVTRDTCTAPGTDPVHNFMDYSYDSCMNHFTPGQINRMRLSFIAYRT